MNSTLKATTIPDNGISVGQEKLALFIAAAEETGNCEFCRKNVDEKVMCPDGRTEEARVSEQTVLRLVNQFKTARQNNFGDRHREYQIRFSGKTIEELIQKYKDNETPLLLREWLKDEIFLKIFFLFPYILRRKYNMRSDLFDEALQNYSLYYLIALKNYNPDSGYPFTHYLVGYLRGAGTKTWRSTGVVTVPSRKPVQMDERLGGQESVDDESSISKQKRPSEMPPDISVDNISPELPPEDIYVIHMPRECGENLIDCLEDVQARDRAHEEVYLRELCDWLADALSREAGILTESERQVLILHYGLFGSPPHRYSEISALRRAAGLSCARSRISQLHSSGIQKIKNYFRQNGILGNLF